MKKDIAILAFSGGLDSSISVDLIKKNYGYDVITLTVDLGGGQFSTDLKKRAKKAGASDCIIWDVKDEFVNNYIFPGMIFQTFYSILGFVVSLLLSIYLSYCIYFIMVCFAFWFGEVRSIVVAYNVGMLMISGQYIPIRLFPEEVLAIIKWTPIPYLVDTPVSIATGLIGYQEWITHIGFASIWCIILTSTSLLIYRSGIKGYEAYGQ